MRGKGKPFTLHQVNLDKAGKYDRMENDCSKRIKKMRTLHFRHIPYTLDFGEQNERFEEDLRLDQLQDPEDRVEY